MATEEARICRDELEKGALLVVCRQQGITWHTVRDGQLDLSTANGMLMGTIKGAIDAFESRRKAERQVLANEYARRAGTPNKTGPIPFGWQADRQTLDEPAAELIRTGVKMIRQGKSVHQVVMAWRASTIKPARAEVWGRISVIKTLGRWRNAGVVSYMDEPVLDDDGKHVTGRWDQIVDVSELEDVRKILLARSGEKRTVNRLCSGIAYCTCGEYLIGSGSRGKPTYMCSARIRGVARPGPHGGINAATLDELARDLVIQHYFAPDLATNTGEDQKAADVAALHGALSEVRARQAKLLDLFTDTDLSRAAYSRKNSELVAREQEIERELAHAAAASAHVRMLQAAARDFWGEASPRKAARVELVRRFETLPLDDRRELLRSIARLTVRPSTGPRDTGVQRVAIET